jgi:hypothetical protein
LLAGPKGRDIHNDGTETTHRKTIAFGGLDRKRPLPGYSPDWTRTMFENIIFGVILLAISYWTVLWLMGRRADDSLFKSIKQDLNQPVRK